MEREQGKRRRPRSRLRGQIIDRGYVGQGRSRVRAWLVRVYLGTTPDGRKIYRARTVHGTRADAEAVLNEWLTELGKGILADSGRMSVADYLVHRWLPAIESRGLSPTTVERYRLDIEKRIIPAIGSIRLDRLQPLHIEALVQQARASGLSDRSVLHLYRVLHRALEMAVRWRLLASNPCDGVEPPRADTSSKGRALEPEELSRLLDAARGTSAYVPIVLAVACGLRRGEVLGLEWPDVDLNNATLTVRQAVVEVGGRFIVKAPKSETSRRTVPLPPLALEALREWREEQAKQRQSLGDQWQGGERVCTDRDGRPLSPWALDWAYRQAAERAGIRGTYRFHDLRHTYGSTLAGSGVPPHTTRELMGHSSVVTTMQLYAHVRRGDREQAAQRLSQMFSQKHLGSTENEPRAATPEG